MGRDDQMEKLIIENVMKELAKRGLFGSEAEKVCHEAVKAAGASGASVCCQEAPIEVPDISGVWVPNPVNLEAIKAMKETTPARIGLFRAGARPKTDAMLKFLADHAQAIDAVFLDVADEFLNKMNLFSVQTAAGDKDEFLKKPDLGRKLSDAGKKMVVEKCQKNPQVQILVVDGLSSSAIEANIPDVLPVLTQGLTAAGIKVGTPFFIKYGRVGIQDEVGMLLNADVVISLIGERPGLVTADSMSAYMIYKPNENTVEADRTMISNIHKGGTPPAEAGALLVDIIKQILAAKCSGMKLNLQ
ncbi:ethanolamine ammonia-lyase subunit EutC [Desulfitibacter alkalitolerans]|uniref:ethanolamine ammonia-lyase subunit EutC n=1 Tax=Desulfitibacter alkalitolerans TaxID=264641 RepID=UPI000487450E|nr:ethanolamine ammonia-lyase subunit EutC [Desulfitibacter alkalitolerans]